MLTRTMAARMPALSWQEAALLPALTPETPRNLLIPTGPLDFRTGSVDGGGRPVDNPAHRGTMAGRALLSYIRNAPAGRQGRRKPSASAQ